MTTILITKQDSTLQELGGLILICIKKEQFILAGIQPKFESGNIINYQSKKDPKILYIAKIHQIFEWAFEIQIYRNQHDLKINLFRTKVVGKRSPRLVFNSYDNDIITDWRNGLLEGMTLKVFKRVWQYSTILQVKYNNKKGKKNQQPSKANKSIVIGHRIYHKKGKIKENDGKKYNEILSRFDEIYEIKSNKLRPMLLSEAGQGKLELVKYLVEECGENVNFDKFHKETPLYRACEFGRLEVAKYLITQGANIELRSTLDMSPLMIASLNNFLEVVRLLLRYGAKPTLNTNYGEPHELMVNISNQILTIIENEVDLRRIKNVLKYHQLGKQNKLRQDSQIFQKTNKNIIEKVITEYL
eukprot:403343627